jgi:hypothetical protein
MNDGIKPKEKDMGKVRSRRNTVPYTVMSAV